MTRKKKQKTSTSGVYALCITVGLIVGVGLTPLMGNLVVMAGIGALAGAVAGYLINKRAPRHPPRHHH